MVFTSVVIRHIKYLVSSFALVLVVQSAIHSKLSLFGYKSSLFIVFPQVFHHILTHINRKRKQNSTRENKTYILSSPEEGEIPATAGSNSFLGREESFPRQGKNKASRRAYKLFLRLCNINIVLLGLLYQY